MLARLRGGIAAWPMAVKVPLSVVLIVVAAAVGLSQAVLSRLSAEQENHLQSLAGAFLDGLSTATMPAVLRRDVWEVFDALDRARGQYSGLRALYTVVTTPDGQILASSDPDRFPTQTAMPTALESRFAPGSLTIDEPAGRAWAARDLREGGILIGRLFAEIDITDLLAVRREVALTLLLVNAALTVAFGAIGYLLVGRMIRPLGILTRHLRRARDGEVVAIAEPEFRRVGAEFSDAFLQFNDLVRALEERKSLVARLADEEKMALLGKLASGMAHEVNNPLGGMLNAIDTLQAHGHDPEIRRRSLDFLHRGLAGIRNVVRATLVSYKGGGDPSRLTGGDLEDLPFLIQHEAEARRLRIAWQSSLPDSVEAEGGTIRQILLNLLLNACAASPTGGLVRLTARLDDQDALVFVIADEGPGLPVPMADILTGHPAETPPKGTSGLGLWTTARLVARLDGSITLGRHEHGSQVIVAIPLQPRRPVDHAA
jgi:signal transduction histidine kinase